MPPRTLTRPETRRDAIHERVPVRDVAALLADSLCDAVRITELVPDGPRRIEDDRFYLEIDAEAFATLARYPHVPKGVPARPELTGVDLAEIRREWEETLQVYDHTIRLTERLRFDATALHREREIVKRYVRQLEEMEARMDAPQGSPFPGAPAPNRAA